MLGQFGLAAAAINENTSDTNELSGAQWNFSLNEQKYDGADDYLAFKEQFDERTDWIKATEEQKLKMFKSVLSTRMYKKLKDYAGEDNMGRATLQMLHEGMVHLCCPRPHVYNERKRFKFCKMVEMESVHDHYARLKAMAELCKFKHPDEEIQDQLIIGLTPELYDKVMNTSYEIPLSEALKVIQGAESMETGGGVCR